MSTSTPAPRRTTLADVARESGVSVALASIVMRGADGASEASRIKVKAAAAALGYRPDSRARALRSLRSRLLGVSLSLTQPFHAELVDAMYAEAEELGYSVVLSATGAHRSEAKALDALLDAGCEAVIAIAPTGTVTGLAAVDTQLPLVSLLRTVPGIDSVGTDDASGIIGAVDHLVSLGHTHIAHIDGGTAVAATERRAAYLAAMAGHGLGDKALVIPGGPDERDGAAAADRLLEAGALGPLPTALLVFNDRCALGAIDALERAGIGVPARVSVVGFDDSQFARLAHIGLTSVRQDVTALADSAVGRAIARISGEGPSLILHPAALVVRHSTTTPPIR